MDEISGKVGTERTFVRALAPADAAAYVALRREMLADAPWAFAAGEGTDGGLDVGVVEKRCAGPDQRIVGAFVESEGGGALIGAAGLYREAHAKLRHRAKVWGVYVRPSYRGRGAARAMMAEAISIARGWEGVDSVGLCVSERAREAKALYESMGFVAWGREPGAMVVDGERYDEWHLVLPLR